METLVVVVPPDLPGVSMQRTQSAGIGVAVPKRRIDRGWEMLSGKRRRRRGRMLPHMDLLYTLAVAEQQGAAVSLLDIGLEGWSGETALDGVAKRVEPFLAAGGRVWIGVALSMPSLLHDLAFAQAIKRRHPSAVVFLLGNVILTTLPHWVGEAKGVDAVVYGEPEAVFGQMMLSPGDTWKQVPGVVDPSGWDGPDTESVFSPGMVRQFSNWVRVGNLSMLPRPAWHLLDPARYSATGKASDCGVFVQASRGCPIGCTMCPYMVHEGRPFRPNSPERVVDDLRYLFQTFGINKVRFRDPNFGYDKRQMRALCNALVQSGIPIRGAAELSLEMCDDDDIELLNRAGINTILTGVETHDEACMESIGQKVRINEKLREKIALCDRLGMQVFGSFVVGAPEEDWDSLARTIAYARGLDAQCSATIMTPFPGTPLFYRAIEEGLLEPRMQYEGWNSYTATMRTYALSRTDLTIARLWFRMETLVPLRLRRARRSGHREVARTAWALLPRIAMRSLLRVYVAWRRVFPAAPAGPVARADSRKRASAIRRQLWQSR